MQHVQLNYKRFVLAVLALLLAAPASADDVPKAGDPILDGGPPGPCDPGLAGPDYVAGTDSNGHPVPQADLPAGKVPVPGHLAIPLKSRRRRPPAYVEADGSKLDTLLNPPSACPRPRG